MKPEKDRSDVVWSEHKHVLAKLKPNQRIVKSEEHGYVVVNMITENEIFINGQDLAKLVNESKPFILHKPHKLEVNLSSLNKDDIDFLARFLQNFPLPENPPIESLFGEGKNILKRHV